MMVSLIEKWIRLDAVDGRSHIKKERGREYVTFRNTRIYGDGLDGTPTTRTGMVCLLRKMDVRNTKTGRDDQSMTQMKYVKISNSAL